MHIDTINLNIVKGIIKKHIPKLEVWAFGSRVHGHNLKPFSDLDLVIITDHAISIEILAKLKHDFTQSDLPFKVDLVEWCFVDEYLKKEIRENHIVIQDSVISNQ